MTPVNQKTCPICQRNDTDIKFAPFCSQRCADVDLSRWLKGSYVIPGPSLEVTDEAPPDPTQSKDDF